MHSRRQVSSQVHNEINAKQYKMGCSKILSIPFFICQQFINTHIIIYWQKKNTEKLVKKKRATPKGIALHVLCN